MTVVAGSSTEARSTKVRVLRWTRVADNSLVNPWSWCRRRRRTEGPAAGRLHWLRRDCRHGQRKLGRRRQVAVLALVRRVPAMAPGGSGAWQWLLAAWGPVRAVRLGVGTGSANGAGRRPVPAARGSGMGGVVRTPAARGRFEQRRWSRWRRGGSVRLTDTRAPVAWGRMASAHGGGEQGNGMAATSSRPGVVGRQPTGAKPGEASQSSSASHRSVRPSRKRPAATPRKTSRREDRATAARKTVPTSRPPAPRRTARSKWTVRGPRPRKDAESSVRSCSRADPPAST